MNSRYYPSKTLNARYHVATIGGTGSRIKAQRIDCIVRRNKLRKIYDLEGALEDERQGYILAPYILATWTTVTTTASYVTAIDCYHSNGIEPDRSSLYITKKK